MKILYVSESYCELEVNHGWDIVGILLDHDSKLWWIQDGRFTSGFDSLQSALIAVSKIYLS